MILIIIVRKESAIGTIFKVLRIKSDCCQN